MTGLPDDPSDRPTRMAEYDADGWQQVLEHEPDGTAEEADSAAPDGAPEPWYRNRVLLALWALMVALLLTLVIYGMVELSRGGGETSGPATTTSSTTPTRSSTTTPSNTTSPSTTPPSSSTTEAPPPETPEQTPEEAPPPPNNSPSPAPPPRHHHHLHLPHFS